MNNINIEKIETLLKDRRYDEVKVEIQKIIDQEMTDKDKGAILTGFISVYMELINSINSQYIDALKEVLVSMNLINKAESETVDQIKLEEVKKKLSI